MALNVFMMADRFIVKGRACDLRVCGSGPFRKCPLSGLLLYSCGFGHAGIEGVGESDKGKGPTGNNTLYLHKKTEGINKYTNK